MSEADLNPAMVLVRQQGWNQGREDWKLFLDEGVAWVAVQKTRVVGTVAVLPYGSRLGWISMLLVRRDSRGRGIGKALFARALASRVGRGVLGLDATPEGSRLYRKFGFKTVFSMVRMLRSGDRRGKSRPEAWRSPGFRAPRWVQREDAWLFGASRSLLLDFGLFQGVRLEPKFRSWSFLRPGRNFVQIGPLKAFSLAEACKLVESCRLATGGSALGLDVPLSQRRFLVWLERQGFRRERVFHRMFFPAADWTRRQKEYFAVAGPEFG
jgi:GNAT superfamily N-acetyltransferase